MPEDDSTFYEDEGSGDNPSSPAATTRLVVGRQRRTTKNASIVMMGMDSDDEEEQEIEDSYEVAPSVLLDLPEKDDKKYPQENKQYFATKKYVRNDKYDLDKLLPEGMELPPLSSIYKM